MIGRDTTGNAFPIPERGIHCGRERGDVLFSEDGYVSGLHCRVSKGQDGRIYLTDVGSSNGTFIRSARGASAPDRRHPADGSAAFPHRLLSGPMEWLRNARFASLLQSSKRTPAT